MDEEELHQWRFRNLDSGNVKTIRARDLETAWKELEQDYSDPLHAWQEWAAIDG